MSEINNSARIPIEPRVLELINNMTLQQLTIWWFQWMKNIFLEWITPGQAFSPWQLLMSDGDNVTSFHTVIDELHDIFSEHLTPNQKAAISQEAEIILKNLSNSDLHNDYPALEKLHWSRPCGVPASIVGVRDGDELVGRYIEALLRFTDRFKDINRLQLTTLEKIQMICQEE